MGNMDFDATNVEPNAPMDAIPSGKYIAKIAETEIKETKSGKGKYLQITLEIVEGQFKGRKVFDRLNLWNASAQAKEIAEKTLSAICHSIDILKIRNHEELKNNIVEIKVDKRTYEEYGEQNEVKGYSSAGKDRAPSKKEESEETEDSPQEEQKPAWAK